MQVVVLAAGRGERFLSQGHMVPKPLIFVDGKRMITRALEQTEEVTYFPVVVAPQFLVADLRYHTPPSSHPEFVAVKHVQQGAAMSLLTAACVLKDDEPVLVLDCDTIFNAGVLKKFAEFAKKAFAHGRNSAVLCFRPEDVSDRYSFALLDKSKRYMTVDKIAEKVRISDIATCGVHAFKTWSIARQAIYEMVILKTLTNNEYYLAPAHNNITDVSALCIGASEFYHVGTPEEVEAYEQAIS